MRTIELKTVETEEGLKLNYNELCHTLLKSRAPQGFSVEEMKVRLAALKEFPPTPVNEKTQAPDFDSLPASIDVSEETARELMNCLSVFRWARPDDVIVGFDEYIREVCGNKKEDKKED